MSSFTHDIQFAIDNDDAQPGYIWSRWGWARITGTEKLSWQRVAFAGHWLWPSA
jgi:hypothetical protein